MTRLEHVPVLVVFQVCVMFCIHVYGEFQVVDLTHTYITDGPAWSGNPILNMTNLKSFTLDENITFVTNWFSTPEHYGTHIDAPSHLLSKMWHTHQIPIEHLIGPGVVIDVTQKVISNLDYQVTIEDLRDWETNYGKIPKGAMVMMNSGWTHRFHNSSLVFGTSTPQNTSSFHFPSFHPDAVTWLVTQRKINVVGVDTPSVEYGQEKKKPPPVHMILLSNQIPAAENVANLHKVPSHGSMIFAPVYKLYNGSGGPARIFATFQTDSLSKTSSSIGLAPADIMVIIFSLIFCLISIIVFG